MLALTLPQFAADATVTPSPDWDLADDSVLLRATIEALASRIPALVERPARLGFTTNIPRQVGLAGSSAIIIATLRALADFAGFEWDAVDLARTALEVETEVLGWAAGPQDRVVQAYEGLVDMDFAQPWDAARYRRLDPTALPQLFVAWSRDGGEASDVVHSDVRSRWEAGDAEVTSVMSQFASLARRGRAALDAGEAATTWPALMNEAFALRRRLWTIDAVSEKLVSIGCEAGAGVTFAGSGGAVVGCIPDSAAFAGLETGYTEAGFGFLQVTA